VKERPILFSGPMVLALLDGRKTQTRRLVGARGFHAFEGDEDNDGWPLAPVERTGCLARLPATYGAPGDRLWVRETWYDNAPSMTLQERTREPDGSIRGVEYRATHDCASFEDGCPCNPDGDGKRSEWRPSIFMPRWASRLTLEVTSVRVEPLQSISERDACAEGMGSPLTRDCKTPKFAALWDAINGERAPWASNPWVWVIEFRRLAGCSA
jgi:hypothetical protein